MIPGATPKEAGRGGAMNRRFNHLDGLRGIAALNVMCNHAIVAFAFALYSGDVNASHGDWDLRISAWPLLIPVAGANFSVCVFLVLSGFVLAHSYVNATQGFVALISRRYARLGLPILAVVLLSWSLLAAGLIRNHEAAVLTRSSWLDNAMRQQPDVATALTEALYRAFVGPWNFMVSYDSSLWTMPIEFAGSLLLIVAILYGRRLARFGGNRVMAGCALLAFAVLGRGYYLSLMAMGAALYLFEPGRRLRAHGPRSTLLAVAFVVSIVLGTVPYSVARGPVWDAVASAAPLGRHPAWLPDMPAFVPFDGASFWHGAGAILLLLVVESWPAPQAPLTARIARFLGAISFPLYLVHLPVLYSVGCGLFLAADAAGLGFWPSAGAAALCYGVVSIALASGLTHVVERPALWLSSRLGRAVDLAMARIAARAGTIRDMA